MPNTFDQERKAWADGHMPLVLEAIRSVIHRFIQVDPAAFYDDVMGVDIYMSLPNRWAVRVRRAKYFHRYCDITFRITPTGNELDKVIANADYMFYGWVNEDETALLGWVILEIPRLREQVYGMVTGVYTVPGGNALCAIPLEAVFKAGAISAMSESIAQKLTKVI